MITPDITNSIPVSYTKRQILLANISSWIHTSKQLKIFMSRDWFCISKDRKITMNKSLIYQKKNTDGRFEHFTEYIEGKEK